MRITHLIAAAGLAVAGLTAATGAEAQSYRGNGYGYDQRYDRDGRYDRYDRNWDRGHHYGWDRGRHNGWNNRSRYYNSRYYNGRRCWTEWRYGDRVTVCRR